MPEGPGLPTLPLSGLVVLDVTRMLPGAVLARTLVDLGARVIKIEEPRRGDPMRSAPPLVEGIGTGFCTFFRGVESVCLDLRSEADAETLRRLSTRADVLVESFRPGTMERWGLAPGRLAEGSPRLVTCSLPGFAPESPLAARAGHDLNFAAATGLLSLLGGGVPGIQLVDITTGLLASLSIMAALFASERTGRGTHLVQPLAAAPLPFLAWAFANGFAGGTGVLEELLAGRCAAYGVYLCADGRRVALGAVEPKLWTEWIDVAGLQELAAEGMLDGARGEHATARLAARMAEHPSTHWLALAAERNLPLTPVRSVEEARQALVDTETEELRLPGGGVLSGTRGFVASGSPIPPAARRVPALGQHTESVLAELASQTGSSTTAVP